MASSTGSAGHGRRRNPDERKVRDRPTGSELNAACRQLAREDGNKVTLAGRLRHYATSHRRR